MAEVMKFMFDTSFVDLEHEEKAGKEDVVAAPVFSEEELSAARQQAHAEGVTEGLEQARAETEALVAHTLTQFAGELSRLVQVVETKNSTVLSTALTIARKLAPALVNRNPLAEIEAVVGECLREVIDEPRVVVRIAEDLLESFQHHVDDLAAQSGFTGQIVVVGEASLGAGDCLVEWADGGAERNMADLEGAIESVIERVLQLEAAAPDVSQPAGRDAEPAQPLAPGPEELEIVAAGGAAEPGATSDDTDSETVDEMDDETVDETVDETDDDSGDPTAITVADRGDDPSAVERER